MSYSPEMKETLSMTSSTIGKDLLAALVGEIKLLPDLWAKMPQAKQDDVIERLRKRVDDNVRMAAHLIASNGRTVVQGDLEQITIKEVDELYTEAVTEQKCGISFLQRSLGIGYNRAVRILVLLEQAGVVSAPDANGARTILIDKPEA